MGCCAAYSAVVTAQLGTFSPILSLCGLRALPIYGLRDSRARSLAVILFPYPCPQPFRPNTWEPRRG